MSNQILAASEVSSEFFINVFPHGGKDENGDSSIPSEDFFVVKLLELYAGCIGNVTTDNSLRVFH